MSTFQRRKSRAGTAFEHQLEFLFKGRGIRYSAQPYTEGKSKPDFIFPSIECYRDEGFPSSSLTMLGAKTTIKERKVSLKQMALKHLEQQFLALVASEQASIGVIRPVETFKG